HLLLGCRRHLRLRQSISVLAIHCLQSQHIFAAQTANRSGKIGFAACPLAKLAGYLGRELRVRGTGHLLQGLRYLAVRQHSQERRLPQGNSERGLQRVVEYWIARAVGKVGEDKRVLLGQPVSLLTPSIVKPARNKKDDEQRDSQNGNRELIELSRPSRGNFCHRHRARACCRNVPAL